MNRRSTIRVLQGLLKDEVYRIGEIDGIPGNKTEAARRLGLTARTLSNKMKIWKAAGLVH